MEFLMKRKLIERPVGSSDVWRAMNYCHLVPVDCALLFFGWCHMCAPVLSLVSYVRSADFFTCIAVL